MPVNRPLVSSDRPMIFAIGLLLALCFLTGGSSQETNAGVMVSQLLALPLLLLAVVRIWRRGRSGSLRLPLIVVALIVLVPLVQLLPIPEWLWTLPSWRDSLRADLAAAGVNDIRYHWSLAPAATQAALWSLLPATALFLATLTLPHSDLRKVLWMVIAAAAFSLILAIVQLALPQDSFLNPYPAFEPVMGGVFANRNHQATTLVVGLVLAVAFALNGRIRQDLSEGNRSLQIWGCASLALLFTATLPLVGSRAGVMLAIFPFLLVALTSGVFDVQRLRHHRPTQLALLATIVVFVVVAYGAIGWAQVESNIDGQRWTYNREAFALAMTNAPLGSGIGSFVPLFAQASEASLQTVGYVNHAHDEYVQWWLEGGVLGVTALVAALFAFFHALRSLILLPAGSRLRATGLAAWTAILVILLHSIVDYPLRTPALMSIMGVLAGTVMAAAAQTRERQRQ